LSFDTLLPGRDNHAVPGTTTASEVGVLDERLQQMLSELRRALYEAISDSSEVHRTWQQLREEGYSLYLVVDCKREEGEDDVEPLPRSRSKRARPTREPAFRINGSDLSFLKSIGIDPIRRRRSS
jgi:hypothetical protein